MNTKSMGVAALFLSFVYVNSGVAKVYRNIPVGKYDATFDLKQCGKKTLLAFMMEQIYPAMQSAAKKQAPGGEHIDGVKNGEGVEIRLTDDVTTYHVKYKADTQENAERSGRSFGAVGTNPNKMQYVADASDSYYLQSLEEIGKNEAQLKAFYEAIFKVVIKCDSSGFAKLNEKSKEVAGDFVAVYVAEEYRHLVGGKGKLGTRFNWDDALLQVTMLASFHSGQKANNGGMFYEGKFTDQVYDQQYKTREGNFCVYKNKNRIDRSQFEKRQNQLNDYWQFNAECRRSGINLTRSDFTKMGQAITKWAAKNDKEDMGDLTSELGGDQSVRQNFYDAVATYLINNNTPKNLKDKADSLISTIVDLLMEVRDNADEITDSL